MRCACLRGSRPGSRLRQRPPPTPQAKAAARFVPLGSICDEGLSGGQPPHAG